VLEYHDMIVIVRDRIRDAVQNGMTLEQVKAARLTRDFDPRYAAPSDPGATVPGGGGAGLRGAPPRSLTMFEGGSLNVATTNFRDGLSADQRRALQRTRVADP
jgi:hypothetical protein